jgi:hypothetical protein
MKPLTSLQISDEKLENPWNYEGLLVFHLNFLDFVGISQNHQDSLRIPVGTIDQREFVKKVLKCVVRHSRLGRDRTSSSKINVFF